MQFDFKAFRDFKLQWNSQSKIFGFLAFFSIF